MTQMLYKLVTNLSKSVIAALSSLFCCLLAQLVSAHLALISSFFHCLVTVLVLAPGPSLRRNLVSCNCLKFNTCLDTPLHGPSQRALGRIIGIFGHVHVSKPESVITLLHAGLFGTVYKNCYLLTAE